MATRGQVHEVLYKFDAEAPEELSVLPKQRVLVMPDGDKSDGWSFVELMDSSAKTGFVPTQFIKAVPGETALPHSASAEEEEAAPQPMAAPTPTQAPSTELVPLDGATGQRALEAAGQLVAPSDPHTAPATEEFSHLFATHEVWYKQASERRQATFAALNTAVTELTTKAADSEARTAGLLDRIAELDSLIEDERCKWEEKLREEQAALAAGTALLTDISSSAQS